MGQESFGLLNWNALPYLGLILPIWLFLRFSRLLRRRRIARLQPNSSQNSGDFLLLKLIIIFIMLLTLLRPYRGFEEYNLDYQQQDLFLIIDVSKSMLAADVLPSRLEVAKRKAAGVLDYIEQQGLGGSVGLILFAGDAYVFCPLTEDYGALRVYLDSVEPTLLRSQGTSLNAALQVALESLDQYSSDPTLFILLTDGEDADFSPSAAGDLLKSGRIALAILGIGTVAGAPIPIGNNRYLSDSSGQTVTTRMSLQNLRLLADKTKADFITLRPQQDEAEILLGHRMRLAGQSKKSEDGRHKIRVYREFGAQLLWVPALLFLYWAWRCRVVLLLLLALFPLRAQAESNSGSDLHSAYQAYQFGDYEKARSLFEKEYRSGTKSFEVVSALASSYYKKADYDKAEKLFSLAAEVSKDSAERFSAYYNRGTTLLMAGKYQQAVSQLEQALKIVPEDIPAGHNLELARRQARNAQEQNSSSGGNDENSRDGGGGDSEDRSREQEQMSAADNSQQSLSADENPESQAASASGSSAAGSSELSQEQAILWLDSISDEPVILRQHLGRAAGGQEQKW